MDKHDLEYAKNLHSVGIEGDEDGQDGFRVAHEYPSSLGLNETVSAADVMGFLCDIIEQADEIDRLTRENKELRAIVERYPKMKDGETAYPGRDAYVIDNSGVVVLGEVAIDQYAKMISIRVYRERWRQGNGDYEWFDLDLGYSTREAAEAAREAGNDE